MTLSGQRLRNRTLSDRTLPLIGVFDAFSASLAAYHPEGIFLSGFGLAASYYGMPNCLNVVIDPESLESNAWGELSSNGGAGR